MKDPAKVRRESWSARVIRPGDDVDLDKLDDEYWLSIPAELRTEVAWQLSKELWTLAGYALDDEQELSRSVVLTIRR